MVLVLIANLVVFIIYKMEVSNPIVNTWARKKMVQFKYNAYIRYYMLVYFDATFFSVMKIMEGNNTTTARKMALLLSYVLFVISIVMPVFLIAIVYRRFDILKLKEAKQSFNSLLLKIDKASKWRVMNPAYFFARRLLTAMLLTLPIDNTFIFLQYVFILMSSHAYILYMVAVKPFQTPSINTYVLANETFYSALIIAIFIFSDATPELNIKFGAGVALMVSLVLLVLANIGQNIYTILQGPEKLKRKIKESKLKRAEKEALEKAEEEERRMKKKKEEEEFTKLPDDNVAMGSDAVTPGDGKTKKPGKKKDLDQVEEAGLGNVGDDDFKKKSGKLKGQQDDVTHFDGPTSKKRKGDTETGTNFGTNPTGKDFL